VSLVATCALAMTGITAKIAGREMCCVLGLFAEEDPYQSTNCGPGSFR
jgi:hypothetical protein